jgi:seryl-tRNA synthetase
MSAQKNVTPANILEAERALRDGLIQSGLLIPCGVDGIYGRGPVFEDVLQRFDNYVTRATQNDGATRMHFPPVMNRKNMERADYLDSFPHLAGIIFSFFGTDTEHKELVECVHKGEDWSRFERITDVVLTPAACHPLYPTCTGNLPSEGKLIDLTSYCFRHEPSGDPTRMQMFRMREHVRMGKPDEVLAWRDTWTERGLQLLKNLGLAAYIAPANDPFFGRGGRMLAANQREQQLKFEIVLPIIVEERPTAIMSFNYHQDHFSALYDIKANDGGIAHTACLGFGMERIIIGLFKTHGFEPAKWPAEVRAQLGY